MQVKEAAEAEWEAFKTERAAGVEEINQLRQRVAEEESRKKTDRPEGDDKPSEPAAPDAPMAVEEEKPAAPPASAPENGETTMDVDDAKPAESQPVETKAGGESKEDATTKKPEAPSAPAAGDDDDAVEY